MTIDQIAGAFALAGQAVAAIGWLIVAVKTRQRVAIWLACAFILLWIPVIIRFSTGEVYALDGKRIITTSFVISRIIYIGAFSCFAISAVVAVKGGEAKQKTSG